MSKVPLLLKDGTFGEEHSLIFNDKEIDEL
jgi:hypothetical protein